MNMNQHVYDRMDLSQAVALLGSGEQTAPQLAAQMTNCASSHILSLAMGRDPRFARRKSGVVKWRLVERDAG